MLTASSLANADGMVDATDVDELDLDVLVVETEMGITVPRTNRARRLDILVAMPPADEGTVGKPVLVIEYRVDADEGQDQTADYAAWSGERAFELAGRQVLPLQVFLCPARGEGNDPAEPFVNFDYDSYVAWLDAMTGLDKTEQASFLLREFRTCLGQRADVTDDAQVALLAKLENVHGEAIEVLRCAGASDLAHHASVLAKHEEVFALLGVNRKRHSKGYSPVIEALRSACQQQFEEGFWRIGGSGSLAAIFVPMVDRVREHIGNPKIGMSSVLRVHYYADRPKHERCRLCLEVIGNLPALDAAANKQLRDNLAASLREALRADVGADPARGAVVFALPLSVPGVNDVDDDTDERAVAVADEIGNTAVNAKRVEGALLAWVEQTLPGLLPDSSN